MEFLRFIAIDKSCSDHHPPGLGDTAEKAINHLRENVDSVSGDVVEDNDIRVFEIAREGRPVVTFVWNKDTV